MAAVGCCYFCCCCCNQCFWQARVSQSQSWNCWSPYWKSGGPSYPDWLNEWSSVNGVLLARSHFSRGVIQFSLCTVSQSFCLILINVPMNMSPREHCAVVVVASEVFSLSLSLSLSEWRCPLSVPVCVFANKRCLRYLHLYLFLLLLFHSNLIYISIPLAQQSQHHYLLLLLLLLLMSNKSWKINRSHFSQSLCAFAFATQCSSGADWQSFSWRQWHFSSQVNVQGRNLTLDKCVLSLSRWRRRWWWWCLVLSGDAPFSQLTVVFSLGVHYKSPLSNGSAAANSSTYLCVLLFPLPLSTD